MSVYRTSSVVPDDARPLCETCGLRIDEPAIPDGLSFARETIFVLTRTTRHGNHDACPGAPRVRFDGVGKAVLRWLDLA